MATNNKCKSCKHYKWYRDLSITLYHSYHYCDKFINDTMKFARLYCKNKHYKARNKNEHSKKD